MSINPDSWRVKSPRFCGTHTTDEDVARYWLDQGEAYPLYSRPDLPAVRGVSIDADSPKRTGVLITFERELSQDQLRFLHDFISK